jgi:hypothetical protein
VVALLDALERDSPERSAWVLCLVSGFLLLDLEDDAVVPSGDAGFRTLASLEASSVVKLT